MNAGPLLRKFRHLFRRKQFERDLEEEIRFHLEMSPDAPRAFGNATSAAEASREEWSWRWLDELIQDLRYAGRTMQSALGFTTVAALTLALGIGANTAVFSVLYGGWLAPLRYPQPSRLVDVSMIQLTGRRFTAGTSLLNLNEWRSQNRVFEELAAHRFVRYVNLTGAGPAEELTAHRVSANLFPLLGAAPMLGRGFLPEEDAASGPRAVLLSYGLWKSRFGADPGAVGRQITIDGEPFTIAGVMPERFSFPPMAATWSPVVWLSLNLPPDYAAARDSHALSVVGRLRPGVSIRQAQSEMQGIAARLAAAYPSEDAGWGAAVEPLSENRLLQQVRPTLKLLMAAAAALLLITCVNVANLLLARSAGRRREFAVRAALGVTRRRIARQLLTETCLLGCVGGGFGVLVAMWAVRVIKTLLPASFPRVDEIAVSAPALMFALACSAATGVVFGLAPAWQAGRVAVEEELRETSRTAPRRNSLARALVASEVALAVVLLAAAGLLIESFRRAASVDLGFAAEHVLTMRLPLAKSAYPTGTAVQGFREELLRRVASIPSVERAGIVSSLPLGIISQGTDFEVEGRQAPDRKPSAAFAQVSGDYLRVLRIPLSRGRYFDRNDRRDSAPVAIVSESLAQASWPGEDAIGKRIQIANSGRADWFTVAGVVHDVRNAGPESPADRSIYALNEQLVVPAQGNAMGRFVVLAVRTSGRPALVIPAIRAAVADLDRNQPIADIRTMDELIDRRLAGRKLQTALLGIFAGLALALAAIGVFGVVSYSVAARTNEIGIRMALGARPSAVMALIARQAGVMALAGIVLGTAGAFASAPLLRAFLFGVRPAEPRVVFSVAAALLLAVVAAVWLPARRAIRLDPVSALRRDQ